MFEGTAKRLLVARRDDRGDLRALGPAFWHRVVAAAGARVLSTVRHDGVDAYLLSESSLFVWPGRVLMITCGTTRLTAAAREIIAALGGADQLEVFRYERKNEVFPHEQPTHFLQDARELARLLPGAAYRLGPVDEHHLYVLHLDRRSQIAEEGVSAELVMCGLSAEGRAAFAPRVALHPILHELLDGFEIDEHHFEPQGYSLNAIRGDRYVAVHVTPQASCSYASFETNAWSADALPQVLGRVAELFGPRACDVVSWEWGAPLRTVELGMPLRRRVLQELSSGYRLQLASYAASEAQVWAQAQALELT